MLTRCLYLLFFVVNFSWQFSQLSVGGGGDGCPLPRIDHGRSRLRVRAKMVKFSCFPRYELVGNKYATCLNGRWDEQPPVCVRSGCEVPEVDNGVVLRMRQDAWLVFFCLPGYKLYGSLAIYCDGRSWNTSAPMCVDESAPAELSCDFETVSLCGWTQDELHDFDWRRLNRKTPSTFLSTGPSYDHTLGKGKLGYYMYIESTSRSENDTARLLSPIYNSSLAVDGCFSFFYHMYGMSVGGLRVYQKPDRLALPKMLGLSTSERQRYLLFEKWSNQGDFWYQSVTNLTDFSDDFQIVIEGIRGQSFTSDIAIDDVAILHGDSCAAAASSASTPNTFSTESCADRCEHVNYEHFSLRYACGCTEYCAQSNNCCPDYFDLCVFNTDTTTTPRSIEEFPSNTSRSQEPIDTKPQTQKLVGTTPQINSPTVAEPTKATLTTITTTVTTPSTTTTTEKPTKTTTLKPTTKKATASYKITSKKPKFIPRLVFKSTTPIYNATGLIHKDSIDIVSTTVKHVETTTKQEPTTSTTIKPTTVKMTTTLSHGISRTWENHNQYHDMVKQAIKDKATAQLAKKGVKEPESGGGGRAALAVCLLAVCAGAVLLAAWSRSARGRATLQRLRGRVAHDPEVRYLTGHTDDE